MEQNKMLLMAKERQEVEMTAQGETLEVRILQGLACFVIIWNEALLFVPNLEQVGLEIRGLIIFESACSQFAKIY